MKQEKYLLYAKYARLRAEEHFEMNPNMTATDLLIALAGDVVEAQGLLIESLREYDR